MQIKEFKSLESLSIQWGKILPQLAYSFQNILACSCTIKIWQKKLVLFFLFFSFFVFFVFWLDKQIQRIRNLLVLLIQTNEWFI